MWFFYMNIDELIKIKPPNMYFLDRCAVIEIKKVLNGEPFNDRWIALLKNLDRFPNIIFTYLAAIEGNRALSDLQAKQAFLVQEALAMSDFFKHTLKDSERLANNSAALTSLGQEPMFDLYVEFYKQVNPLLINDISKNDAPKLHAQIISIADGLGINNSDLIVICSLAKLWGNPHAKKVLKFKRQPDDGHIFGAVSDIMFLTRIHRLGELYFSKAKFAQWNRAETHIVTFDKNLRALSEELFDQDGPRFIIKYHNSLFPNMTDKQRGELVMPLENNSIRMY